MREKKLSNVARELTFLLLTDQRPASVKQKKLMDIENYFPIQNMLNTDSQCVRRVAQQTSNKNRLTIAKET